MPIFPSLNYSRRRIRRQTVQRQIKKVYARNRAYCQSKGIRLSGPTLGRPTEDIERLKTQQSLCRQDELDRIPIEGKFGQGKRRFTLARIMAKLSIISEALIMVSFMVMNLEKILSGILFLFLRCGSEHAGQRTAELSGSARMDIPCTSGCSMIWTSLWKRMINGFFSKP